MSLTRQGLLFLLVGGTQLLLDWAVFVMLTWAGLAVVPSNILARAVAAGSGFWLNGRFTFARGSIPRLGRRRVVRFGLLWCALTALSTILLGRLAGISGLKWAWLAKPLVEGALAVISFFIQRHWVYR